MAAPTYSLPTIGSDNSVADPLVRTALSDLKTLLTGQLDADNLAASSVAASELASDAVTTAKILNSNVTDAKLASPNNSTYKTILTAATLTTADLGAGTYFLYPKGVHSGGALAANTPHSSATGLGITSDGSGTVVGANLPYVYIDNADFSVGSLTEKLRLRAQVSTNATAWSSVTATFGLYPVTFAGGTDILTPTAGTVVSGSTVAHANPGASGTVSGTSGDFTFPSDGMYVIGFVLSAQMTNNAAALLTAQLQTRNV